MKHLLSFLLITLGFAPCFAQLKTISSEYEKGTLMNGEKTGVWEYYDRPGTLELKINYSTGKLEYLKPDSSRYVIQVDNAWEEKSLRCYPRYLGSMAILYERLEKAIIYPRAAIEKGTTGTVYVSFNVDTTGFANSFQVIRDIGGGCGPEVIRALSAVDNLWLAPQQNKKLYAARFILPVKFRMGIRSGEKITWEKEPRARKEAPDSAFPKARMLEVLEVAAIGKRTSATTVEYVK
jgi:hypothetical protein